MVLARRRRDEAEKRYFDLGQSMRQWLAVQLLILFFEIFVYALADGSFATVSLLGGGAFSLAIAYRVKKLGDKRKAAIRLARDMNIRVRKYGENAYGGPLPPETDAKEWQILFEECLEEERGRGQRDQQIERSGTS